jgi:hypothetical protein
METSASFEARSAPSSYPTLYPVLPELTKRGVASSFDRYSRDPASTGHDNET